MSFLYRCNNTKSQNTFHYIFSQRVNTAYRVKSIMMLSSVSHGDVYENYAIACKDTKVDTILGLYGISTKRAYETMKFQNIKPVLSPTPLMVS